MGGDKTVIAGIGCRRGCPGADIEAALRLAFAAAGRPADALAAPAFKAEEPGLREAAARLGLPLLLVDADALDAAQPRCVTFSEAAGRAVGAASVAEGCALAASGEGGRLILPRVSCGGATCALAEPA
jgi:cobalt-precorrin 5A hydrolase